MDNYKFTVIIERDEDGVYIASVPAIRGCHTQASSLDELMIRTKEVIELMLDQHLDSQDNIKIEFVGLQEIEVQA